MTHEGHSRIHSLEQLQALRDKPAHILGACSAEGVSVARLLQSLGFTDIVLHDARAKEELEPSFRTVHKAWTRQQQQQIWDELAALLGRGRFGQRYLAGIDAGAGLISLGQGWRLDERNRSIVAQALERAPDAAVTSMVELYLALAPGAVAGITGTNGKSTTVAIADAVLREAGVEHRTAGNDRSHQQFLQEITRLPEGLVCLLEISNRQLMQLHRSPAVAAITSLTPDHLVEHGDFETYAAVKRRIFDFQQPGDIAICNADDELSRAAAATSAGTLVECGISTGQRDGVWWVGHELIAQAVPGIEGSRVLATGDDLQLVGDHNRRNAAVAVAVALACGASADSVAPALRSFAGKAQRLERVAELAGVTFYSDIKATTPEATTAAVRALADRHVVLVAGGDDKGLTYGSLADALLRAKADVVLLPGSATELLAEELSRRSVPYVLCGTLREALGEAAARAHDGDAVLVSPAAAGFWTRHLQGKPPLRGLIRSLPDRIKEVPV